MNKNKFIITLLGVFTSLHALAGMVITGKSSNPDIKKIYLFTVYDEHYDYIMPLDSITVNNGSFSYQNDTLRTQLLFVTPIYNMQSQETLTRGGYHFFEAGQNEITVYTDEKGKLQLSFADNKLESQYQQYLADKYELGNRKVLDSLDALFYAARDKDDRKEMARIKEYSGTFYDEATEKLQAWNQKMLAENKGNIFGAYLYYTNQFQYMELNTADDIRNIRAELAQFDEQAKQSNYYTLMDDKLSVMEKTVVGQTAPAIAGLDQQDKAISLADFKGKYVLVDFWSSSCSWCRKETPNIMKTYNAFKNKNFTVLGVSTDFRKADWLKAIKEDGSYWNQLLLPKETRNKTLENYSIIAIPEILLVDPQGNIVAKGLRGEDIYETVKKHVAN